MEPSLVRRSYRRRSRSLSAAAAIAVFAGCLGGAAAQFAMTVRGAEPARPNIVLIVTDDQGWGDLSCHGNPVLDTPHLDALAARGAELTRFYVSPVCSPTRASLMTGRYNYRTRVVDTYRGRSMMDPAETTVAELLRDAGYATGIFGKWHLGDCFPMRAQDQGFDVAVTLRGGGLAQPSEPLENERRYTDPILFRNGEQFQARGYCTDVFFREATAFIAERVAVGQPFFAYITPNAPHDPLHDVPEELYRKYKAKDLSPVLLGNAETADAVARIYAMVENIDENVGGLVSELERLGVAENTLVIFLCDNGPNTARYVGDRRGKKTDVFEGGVLSPFFAAWPDRIPPGARSDRIAAHIDVLPTLLAAAGVAAPERLRIDGRSVLPLLTQPSPDWSERFVVIQSHRGGAPVAEHHMAVIGPRWKLVRPSGFHHEQPPREAPFQLVDLREDPRERSDLSAAQPERAAVLHAAYDAWLEDVSHTRPENFAPPRIVVGTDAEPETTLTWQDWQATGGGWGVQGVWLITAPRPTTFRVTVILENPAAGEALLRLGDGSYRQNVAALQRHVEFEAVNLPAGNADVRFELRQNSSAMPPYQIILTRK